MTPADGALALATEFRDALYALSTTTLVQYEGTHKWFAGNTASTMSATSTWVRFGARPLDETLDALGDPRTWTSKGVIAMQCFTPMQKGRGENDALATRVAHIFRGRTDIGPGIRIGDIRFITLGESEGFFQQNVNVEYEVDDTA